MEADIETRGRASGWAQTLSDLRAYSGQISDDSGGGAVSRLPLPVIPPGGVEGLFGRFNWGPLTTVDQLRFDIHDLDAWAATQRAAETTPILAKRNPQTAALVRRILEVDKSAVERVAEPDPEPETAPGEGYDARHPRRLHCPDIVWPLGVER